MELEREYIDFVKSHPSRVRGLKQDLEERLEEVERSHPSRVRGLKRSWYAGIIDAE